MGITFKTGDIFTSESKVLVNTINCVGDMGKGIALQHKLKFPEQSTMEYIETGLQSFVQKYKEL